MTGIGSQRLSATDNPVIVDEGNILKYLTPGSMRPILPGPARPAQNLADLLLPQTGYLPQTTYRLLEGDVGPFRRIHPLLSATAPELVVDSTVKSPERRLVEFLRSRPAEAMMFLAGSILVASVTGVVLGLVVGRSIVAPDFAIVTIIASAAFYAMARLSPLLGRAG